MTTVEAARMAVVLMIGRQEAINQLLAEHGSTAGCATYLASPDGEARLQSIIDRLIDGDAAVVDSTTDHFPALVLDALMELDTQARLQQLEGDSNEAVG